MDNYQKIKPLKLNIHFHNIAKRRGFTMTELVVAATLLTTMMSVVAPLAVRSSRLWQDSRYYRLALEELTNQWEHLASLDEADRPAAIADLTPSTQISAALPNPVLTAETSTDEDGTRVTLSLTWDRLGQNAPVTLVGWVNPLPSLPSPPQGGTEQ